MMFYGNSKRRRKTDNNNRLHLIMAVIFLLVGLIIFKLYIIQVRNYDLYTALASDQHQAFSKLLPQRGEIFIQDSHDDSNENLYPIATNKNFALVYAVPAEINNPKEVAEKLFEIFNKEEVEKDVEEMLENDDFFSGESETINPLGTGDDNLREFREIKKELEIELRSERIIDDYVKKLSKKNDPYEPIKSKVSEDILNKIIELKLEGIDYVMENYRYYPEKDIGSHILGFVSANSENKNGQYGLEGFFNEELSGAVGSVKAERSANGELIIINDREYKKAQDGSDLILTINRSVQYVACKKLKEAAMRHGADGGSVVVMEPTTGAIIAMCSWPDYDPNNYSDIENINVYNNPSIFNQYEPGSIFKVITMAASVDQNKVSPNTTYSDKGFLMIEGWPKPIKNSDFDTVGAHGIVNMVDVLELSLNTGAIFAMERIGAEKFSEYVENFGFGEKTGIELETEVAGNISNLLAKKIRPVEAATASFGQGITTTPLQMTAAYAAVANGGILMKPYLVKEIIYPDGESHKTQPVQIRRVISERASLLVSGMMVNVIEDGHAQRAAVDGYYVAGKTGTAQVADREKGGYSEDKTIHTFVGFAPTDNPKFVMLVKLDDPKDVDYAASSAAPLFGEIAEFILDYYKVPKER